jgi:hypothetical protein
MIHLSFPLLVAGAAVISRPRAACLAWSAAIAGGTALAALHAAGPAGAGPGSGLAGLPSAFLGVEAALFLAGAALAIAGALVASRGRREPAEFPGAIAVGTAGLWLGWLGIGCLAGSRPASYVAGFLIVGVSVTVVAYAGRRWPRVPELRRLESVRPGSAIAMLIGAVLAGLAPGVGPVFLGVITAALGGYLAEAAHARRMPVAPLLALLLLPTWWLMVTIAGPEGLPMHGLADRPWSPAAELALAALLLVSAWSLAGLWPLHRQTPSLFTAPVGALLVARVAIPVAADGIAHWRALAMPLVIAGLWHAAVSGRRAGAAAALAWIGLLAATPVGELGAALLFGGALLLALSDRMATVARRAALLIRVAGAVVGGAGGLLATAAGLHVEVVYTVLAVAALGVGVARRAPAQASTASAPSATPASA